MISVETPVPLDLVLLHSHVHMDLLESNDGDDLEQVIRRRRRSARVTLMVGDPEV